MKKLLFIFPILLSVLFLSCSDDDDNNDDNNGNNNPEKQRIWERDYSTSGGKKYRFYYTPKGKLEIVLEIFSTERANRYSFTYDSSGKIASTIKDDFFTNKIAYTREYNYANNTTINVIEKEYNEGVYISSFESALTLDDNGRLIKQTNSNSSTTYKYDNNGNLTELKDSYYTYSYRYDNKVSCFSNQGLPAWYWVFDANEDFDLYAGSNNLLESFSNGKKEDSYKYDYDNNGFPTAIYNNVTGAKIGMFAYDRPN